MFITSVTRTCVLYVQLSELVSKISSSEISLFVIRCLTSFPSSVQFDSLTKTKTLATVIHKVQQLHCSISSDILLQKKFVSHIIVFSSGQINLCLILVSVLNYVII